MLMRDAEGRKKEASKVKQTRICETTLSAHLSLMGKRVLGSTSVKGDVRFCAARFRKLTTTSKF